MVPMTRPGPLPAQSRGFSMIEVLVSLIIVVLGLLGLAGMQVRMQQAEFESYQRAQALVLLDDMVERISLHRQTPSCFWLTDSTTGSPYLGVGSSGAPACSASTANNNTQTNLILAEWHNLLRGASETKGGASVGAMVGARGCISYDPWSELTDAGGAIISNTGVYTVAVAWQGMNDTFAPTVNCGNGQYGAETRRRVVFTTFRIAALK